MFDLTNNVFHLKDHWDMIGVAMQTRFKMAQENNFVTLNNLNENSASPYSLYTENIFFSDITVKIMEKYGIDRGHNMLYIYHIGKMNW